MFCTLFLFSIFIRKMPFPWNVDDGIQNSIHNHTRSSLYLFRHHLSYRRRIHRALRPAQPNPRETTPLFADYFLMFYSLEYIYLNIDCIYAEAKVLFRHDNFRLRRCPHRIEGFDLRHTLPFRSGNGGVYTRAIHLLLRSAIGFVHSTKYFIGIVFGHSRKLNSHLWGLCSSGTVDVGRFFLRI